MARKLAALGHLEFDWIRDRFAVAPATAVFTRHSSGCLLLTGARRRGAWQKLQEEWERGDYDVFLREPLPQQRGPATWLVEAEVRELERFCDGIGYDLQIDSGRRIAAQLPRASLDLVALREWPDGRFPRAWFDPRFRRLRTDVEQEREGLWWVEEHRRNVAFLLRGGEWFRIAMREYGPYVAYPQESFITYDRKLEFLTVHNKAPLPPRLARAVTLQSGRLAVADSHNTHTYVNVDEELQELVADRLDAFVRLT